MYLVLKFEYYDKLNFLIQGKSLNTIVSNTYKTVLYYIIYFYFEKYKNKNVL